MYINSENNADSINFVRKVVHTKKPFRKIPLQLNWSKSTFLIFALASVRFFLVSTLRYRGDVIVQIIIRSRPMTAQGKRENYFYHAVCRCTFATCYYVFDQKNI